MNERLRDLMSGRWRGPTAAALRAALATGAVGYRAGVNWRNRRFDRGLDVHAAGVPVVSVGNITAGGTGKTPVVAWVARHFHRWGVKVALISRGYRSLEADESNTTAAGNDEARVLGRLCPGIPHRQQADRLAAAEHAVSHWRSELLVLDDGFQHRRLARDLDIVLIDATNPFGFGHLLPRGLLREPTTALRRADLILITRADAVTPGALVRLHDELDAIAPDKSVAEMVFPPVRLVATDGQTAPLETLDETPLVGFCGIGNPAGFAATLSHAGLHTAEFLAFPDHHHYTNKDVTRIHKLARARGAGAAVTTLKDIVKIDARRLPEPAELPIWAVETGCEIVAGEAAVLERLDALVMATAPPMAA